MGVIAVGASVSLAVMYRTGCYVSYRVLCIVRGVSNGTASYVITVKLSLCFIKRNVIKR